MRSPSVKNSGFTLLELMVTIGVAGVLAAVAIPNMRDFIRNNRLTAAANDLLRSTQIARSEAIKRQLNVVVCASDAPNAADDALACSDDVFKGWIVFADSNSNWDFDDGEMVIERHDLVDPTVTVVNDHDGILSYAPSGFANPAATKTPTLNVVMCDTRGNAQAGNSSTARAVIIEATGRSRVTKDYTQIGTAITAAGACP